MKHFLFPLFLLSGFTSGSYAQWSNNPAIHTPVCTEPQFQNSPANVSDGSGGAFITWSDNRDYPISGSDIYMQHISSSGFNLLANNGIVVCNAGDIQNLPAIIEDGSGGCIIAWLDRRTGSYYNLFAQRIDAAGNTLWTANGEQLTFLTTNIERLQMIPDGNGGAIISWMDYRNGGGNIDIYAQRINASGVTQWATNGLVVCNASANQIEQNLVTDGAQGAIITWIDRRNDEDVYAQRINASGAAVWTANGVAVGAANDYQRYPEIISDLSGGAVITWEDWRNGSSLRDIYAQRVDASGNILWTLNGNMVCNANNSQVVPKIVPGVGGEAIIAWTDYRTNINYNNIYMQRLDLNGNALYTTNGVFLTTGTATKTLLNLLSDGNNGALLTWRDQEVYAQRILANGQHAWSPADLMISTVTISVPCFTPDAGGGYISAFVKTSFASDIYALRVYSNGHTCPNPPAVNLGPDITACSSAVLDAGITGLTYRWSTNDTTQTISTAFSGTYYVQVSDGGSGCSGTDTIQVTINPAPVVSLGPDRILCDSGLINSFIGNQYSYLWSTGDTTSQVNITTSGLYYVDVTSPGNCVSRDSVVITVNPFPADNLGPDITNCGTPVTLDAGNPGATYQWSTGDTTQTIQVSQTGSYLVYVMLDGCGTNLSINYTNATPVVSLGPDFTTCGDTLLDAGNAGSSFLWSDGGSTQTITADTAGLYWVTVTNSSGCQATDSINANVLALPDASIGPDSLWVCDGEVLIFALTDTSGVSAYSITNAFQTSNNAALVFTYNASSPPLLVQSTVSGSNGCSSSAIVHLINNMITGLNQGVPVNTDPTYMFVALTVPASADNWSWDFGDNTTQQGGMTATHTYLANGTYTVCLVATSECDTASSCISFTVSNVGIAEYETASRIYPSLTSGIVYIELPLTGNAQVELLDLTGQVLSKHTIREQRSAIDLSGYPGGMYFLRLTDGKYSRAEKIILQR